MKHTLLVNRLKMFDVLFIWRLRLKLKFTVAREGERKRDHTLSASVKRHETTSGIARITIFSNK